MYKRGIEYVGPVGNAGVAEIAAKYYTVPNSTTDTNRVSSVVPMSLLVQSTAASNAGVDGAVTADTTGTASRKILGLAKMVCDSVGRPLVRNRILKTEDGSTTVLKARGNVFRCYEDGDGGNISDANSSGTFASLVIGTETSTSDAQTFTPNPEANIMIDSSSISSGTSANRAIKLLGADPSPSHTSGRRAFLFTFTDAFTEEIA